MTATASLTRFLLVLSMLMIIVFPPIIVFSYLPSNQALPANEDSPSIILMIGDGMGFEHIKLAQLVEVGEYSSLNMQQLMWNASVTTSSANAAVTDSAAAGTALATGNKTNNGMIGVLPDGSPLESILEFGQSLNKSTGIVSSSYIVDATPAAFSTHVLDRSYRTEIARQLIEEANVDVILGGGASYFSPVQIASMISNGYSVVYNRSSMLAVATGKLFGLFADGYMDYEIGRNYTLTPSISEMTSKSIELLSQDSDGFFLMIEGGLIDIAAHAANKTIVALETIEFDKAVKVALDYVKQHSNTILLVTADHETRGLTVVSHNLSSDLPSNLLTQNENETLRVARSNNITVDWIAASHTDTPVSLFCFGSVFSESEPEVEIDNTEIFVLMKDYFLGSPLNVTPTTSTDSTSTTSTTTETTSTESSTDTTSTTANSTTTIAGNFLETTMIALAAVGAAIVVLIVIVRIRKN